MATTYPKITGVEQAGGYVYTGVSASAPAASGYAVGTRAFMTDIGPSGTVFTSDGTNWVQANGNTGLIIAASGTQQMAWVKQDATYTQLASVAIPANAIPPSALLRVYGAVAFHTSLGGGRTMYVKLNGTVVAQVFPIASHAVCDFDMILMVDPTRQSVKRVRQSIGGGAASTTDGTGIDLGSNINAMTSVSVDLTAGATLTIETKAGGSPSSAWERHSCNGIIVELLSGANGNIPESVAPSTATAFWGDSLTSGSGATTGSDYVSIVSKLKAPPGRVYYNGGVGGETAAQILTRILADKDRGKNWTQVFWLGRNNVGSGSMQADVLAALASAVANLGHSRYIIMTVLNASTEANGSANKTAIDALNTAIKNTYAAANVYDVQALVCTEANGTPNPAWLSDTIHLNDTGYAAVAAAINAKLTANGW